MTINTSCRQSIFEEQQVIPATGHTSGEAVTENYVSATCTVDGSYDEVVYCTSCNAVLSRETKTIAATGHTWGEWEEYDESTHTRKCEVCEETETDSHDLGDDNVCADCGYEDSKDDTSSDDESGTATDDESGTGSDDESGTASDDESGTDTAAGSGEEDETINLLWLIILLIILIIIEAIILLLIIRARKRLEDDSNPDGEKPDKVAAGAPIALLAVKYIPWQIAVIVVLSVIFVALLVVDIISYSSYRRAKAAADDKLMEQAEASEQSTEQ